MQTSRPNGSCVRPATRTTEDYLREREELRRQAAADIAAREKENEGNS